MEERKYWLFPSIMFSTLVVAFCCCISLGIYFDYAYKMKKLELIESGKIKTCIELLESEKK